MSHRTVKDLHELKVGDRLMVSFEPGYGLHNGSWFNGGPGVPATVAGITRHGEVLVLLDKRNYYGAFALDQSRVARSTVDPKIAAGVSPAAYQFFWVTYSDSVRIPDPTYLAPQTHKGPVTCKCGFTNCDVSVSAIVNGQYLCYNCRVIAPRESAA